MDVIISDPNVEMCCAYRAEAEMEGWYVIRWLSNAFGLFNGRAGPVPTPDFVAFIKHCPECGELLTQAADFLDKMNAERESRSPGVSAKVEAAYRRRVPEEAPMAETDVVDEPIDAWRNKVADLNEQLSAILEERDALGAQLNRLQAEHERLTLEHARQMEWRTMDREALEELRRRCREAIRLLMQVFDESPCEAHDALVVLIGGTPGGPGTYNHNGDL